MPIFLVALPDGAGLSLVSEALNGTGGTAAGKVSEVDIAARTLRSNLKLQLQQSSKSSRKAMEQAGNLFPLVKYTLARLEAYPRESANIIFFTYCSISDLKAFSLAVRLNTSASLYSVLAASLLGDHENAIWAVATSTPHMGFK